MGQSRSKGPQRGGGGGVGYFAAALKAPWPINRLFEFLPQRACHVSIREGLFLLPVRLLAAGGSHTSHLAVYRCLVPGRLSCVCVCARVCTEVCLCVCVCVYRSMCVGEMFTASFSSFRAPRFLKLNINANRLRRALIPVGSVAQTKSLLKTVVFKPSHHCNSWITHNWIICYFV